MNRSMLEQYVDLCMQILEAEEDLRELRRQKDLVRVDTVKGSNAEYPYQPRSFRIVGTDQKAMQNTTEIRKLHEIIRQRQENADRMRVEIETWMNTLPANIQRIVRMKYIRGATWENVSQYLGYRSANAAKQKLFRYLEVNQ